jgi:hypothetical protein
VGGGMTFYIGIEILDDYGYAGEGIIKVQIGDILPGLFREKVDNGI